MIYQIVRQRLMQVDQPDFSYSVVAEVSQRAHAVSISRFFSSTSDDTSVGFFIVPSSGHTTQITNCPFPHELLVDSTRVK